MVSTLQQDEAPLAPQPEPARPTPPAGRAPGTARPWQRSFRVYAMACFMELANQVKLIQPQPHFIHREARLKDDEHNNCFPLINVQQIHS